VFNITGIAVAGLHIISYIICKCNSHERGWNRWRDSIFGKWLGRDRRSHLRAAEADCVAGESQDAGSLGTAEGRKRRKRWFHTIYIHWSCPFVFVPEAALMFSFLIEDDVFQLGTRNAKTYKSCIKSCMMIPCNQLWLSIPRSFCRLRWLPIQRIPRPFCSWLAYMYNWERPFGFRNVIVTILMIYVCNYISTYFYYVFLYVCFNLCFYIIFMPIYFYDVRRHANFFILVFNQPIAESFLPQPYPYAISQNFMMWHIHTACHCCWSWDRRAPDPPLWLGTIVYDI
jgi:hypothetical protein